jgi:hypothetical protein
MGDVTVALDGDRFLPRGQAIYAYSRDGSHRTWRLPEAFRSRPLRVCTLTRAGRGPEPTWQACGESIRLELVAGVPVKVEVAKD